MRRGSREKNRSFKDVKRKMEMEDSDGRTDRKKKSNYNESKHKMGWKM